MATSSVCQLLAQTGSSDANVRMQAELTLRQLATGSPDYAHGLVCCALEPTVDPFVRQTNDCRMLDEHAAALALKNYVDTHWTPQSELFIGPEPSAEMKASVREATLHGLGESERSIRLALAAAVAKIAHHDWPEQWPNLLDLLLHQLRTGSADQVHGVLTCLYEILQVDIVDQQIGAVVPVLAEELLRVAQAETLYLPVTRLRAIKIYKACIDALYMIKDAHRHQVRAILERILPGWTDYLIRLLTLPNTDDAAVLLKVEAIRTLSVTVQNFMPQMQARLIEIITVVWTDLEQQQQLYAVESAKEDSTLAWTSQDEDGDATGLSTLIMAQLEFQHQCLRKKAAAAFYGSSGAEQSNTMTKLMPLLVAYLQMTAEQSEVWQEDASRLLQDEEEDGIYDSVRSSVLNFIRTCLERHEESTLHALLLTCQSNFEATTAARAAGDANWWRLEEACLAALCLAADSVIERSLSLQFTSGDLLTELLTERIQQKDFLFLQSRAMLVCGQFSETYTSEMASRIVQVIVSLLSDSGNAGLSIPVRVAAMKTLNRFCQLDDQTVMAPYRAFMLNDAIQLAKMASGETLQLVLETMLSSLQAGSEVPVDVGALSGMLMETWSRFPTDHICASVIEDMYEVIWRQFPTQAPAAYTAAEPYLQQVLSQTEHTGAILFVCQWLSLLARAAPDTLSGQQLQSIMPPFLSTLLSTTQHSVMQEGAQCLSRLMTWNSQLILGQDGVGSTALDAVLQFMARLLDPSTGESAEVLCTIGTLVTQLLLQAPEQMQAHWQALLTATLQRLAVSEVTTQIQSLVMVFAELLCAQTNNIIEFLHSTSIQGTSGMQVLLSKWCDNHSCFHGYFTIKMSIYALSLLLAQTDARLMAVMVRGDLIPSEQYTTVAAPIKLLKLLLAEMVGEEGGVRTSQHSTANSDNEDGFDEDGDEDDDEDEEEGDWEDVEDGQLLVDGHPIGGFLSDMLDQLGIDGEGEDDEDQTEDERVRQHPVYSMDVKRHLVEVFHSLANGPGKAAFYELVQQLTPSEQAILQQQLSL